MTRPTCEDAPCCGCCGTNIYGVNQEEDGGSPPYCDRCGQYHRGLCQDEAWWDDLANEYDPDDEDLEALR